MTAAHDVAIIGAGPIGIELHVALRAAGLDVVHLEAGAIASTIGWWAPGTTFFSSPERIAIAGVPLMLPNETKATREQYVTYLRGVVAQFRLPIRTFTRVHAVERHDDAFGLRVAPSAHGVGDPAESGALAPAEHVETIRAQRVVFAIGNMHRPRVIDVPGESLPHVSHYLDDPHRYFGRRVVVVGGKNSAAEAALRLYRVGADVTVSYRGAVLDPKRVKYWIRPELEYLIRLGRVRWRPETTVAEITPDAVVLAGAAGTEVVPADDVLLMTGYVQDATLLGALGVARTDDTTHAPIVDPVTMESSVPGVYVVGTAVGGSQSRAHHFIENSHRHVDAVTRAVTGAPPPFSCDDLSGGMEES